MSNLYRAREASTPLMQLNALKIAMGFEQGIATSTIIQYIEDGLVTVKHGEDVPQPVISESQESAQAAALFNGSRGDAPDVNQPGQVVETPLHRPEPTAPKPQDEKAETDADRQDDSQSVDTKEALKDAKVEEKNAPKDGPVVVKDEELKPLSAPVEDDKKKK